MLGKGRSNKLVNTTQDRAQFQCIIIITDFRCIASHSLLQQTYLSKWSKIPLSLSSVPLAGNTSDWESLPFSYLWKPQKPGNSNVTEVCHHNTSERNGGEKIGFYPLFRARSVKNLTLRRPLDGTWYASRSHPLLRLAVFRMTIYLQHKPTLHSNTRAVSNWHFSYIISLSYVNFIGRWDELGKCPGHASLLYFEMI